MCVVRVNKGARANKQAKMYIATATEPFHSFQTFSTPTEKGSQPTNKRYKMEVKILSLQQWQMESVC